MKKLTYFLLILIVGLLCAACTNAYPFLEADEFAVYQNGKAAALTEFDEGYYHFTILQEEMGDIALETKRGIKIGSTLDELIAQYDGYLISGWTYYNGFEDYATYEKYVKDLRIKENRFGDGVLVPGAKTDPAGKPDLEPDGPFIARIWPGLRHCRAPRTTQRKKHPLI